MKAVNTRRFTQQQFEYKTGHRGLFFLRVHHRPTLTVSDGGLAKQYKTTRITTSIDKRTA